MADSASSFPSVPQSSTATAGTLSTVDFTKLATVTAGSTLCGLAYSQVIDLTTTGTYVLIPAIAARIRLVVAMTWELETVGGTRSVAPTLSVGGNDSTYDDLCASQTGAAGLLTQAAHTGGLAVTTVSPNPMVDLTTSGLKVKITAAMTGSSPVCTARLLVLYALFPV